MTEKTLFYICNQVECGSMLRLPEAEAQKHHFRCNSCGMKMASELVPYTQYRVAAWFSGRKVSLSIGLALLCTFYFHFYFLENPAEPISFIKSFIFAFCWWGFNALVYMGTIKRFRAWRSRLPRSETNLWPLWAAMLVVSVNLLVFFTTY
ncbi:hypothetical protein [Microbulbifer sp. M83]|uniref:hypothetical protein n=1 Tax=unclassified Microbulbifer TaxID=2619833 RepID=UPI002FE0E85E